MLKVAIFGAGVRGKFFYNTFKEKYDIICFCDSDKSKREYLSLPVISPEQANEDGLPIIIAIKDLFDAAQTLINKGIKEFYIFRRETGEVVYFDMSVYNDLSVNPGRICLLETRGSGSSARALMRYNPYPDIELHLVDDVFKDVTRYHAFLTSALVISQYMDDVYEKPCIELWHGFPIKALNLASFDEKAQESGSYVTDLLNNKRKAVCSYSRLYNIFIGYCMNLQMDKFAITGMPRNDFLLLSDGKTRIQQLLGNIDYKKIVIYTPTFRKSVSYNISGMDDGYIFRWPGFDFDDFDDFLRANDILFLTKLHIVELADITVRESKNIKLLTDEMFIERDMDLYEILNAIDLMITDYSSISIDFLLVDKPVLFAIRDVDEYAAKHGFMTEPFDAWVPGEAVYEYEQFKAGMLRALFGEDLYKKDREKLRRITHKYADASSSKRVLELARRVLRQLAEN